MNPTSIRKIALVAGAAVLTLGLGACASNAGGYGSARMGQESSFHTPQGETGSPHGHGSTAINAGSVRTSPNAGTLGNTGNASTGVGQESTQHTPQGETGSPHTH